MHITELPIQTWTETYIQRLKDNKDVTKIISRCDDVSIDIEVRSSATSFIQKTLSSPVSTRNMCLLDHNNELRKFNSTGEILEYFVNIRLDFYEKRKILLINRYEEKKGAQENLLKFILKLKEENGLHDYMRSPEAFLRDNLLPMSLLTTNVSDLSDTKIKKLQEQLVCITHDIEQQKDADTRDMYRHDLMSLMTSIK